MWKIHKALGFKPSAKLIIASKSEPVFLIGIGYYIKAYNFSDASLSFTINHKTSILSLFNHDVNPEIFFASSANGIIKMYLLSKKQMIQSWTIKHLKFLFLEFFSPISNFVGVCKQKAHALALICSKTNEVKFNDFPINVYFPKIEAFMIANSKAYVALGKKILIFNLITQNWTILIHDEYITNLACKDYIYASDKYGKIIVWSKNKEGQSIKSSFHWHSHQVNSLQISDTHLFSGGSEGVLVMWNLKNMSKSFIPRISGKILSINLSNDQRYIALLLENKILKIVQ